MKEYSLGESVPGVKAGALTNVVGLQTGAIRSNGCSWVFWLK